MSAVHTSNDKERKIVSAFTRCADLPLAIPTGVKDKRVSGAQELSFQLNMLGHNSASSGALSLKSWKDPRYISSLLTSLNLAPQ